MRNEGGAPFFKGETKDTPFSNEERRRCPLFKGGAKKVPLFQKWEPRTCPFFKGGETKDVPPWLTAGAIKSHPGQARVAESSPWTSVGGGEFPLAHARVAMRSL
ncbi:MAG: hypothetical protein C4519_00840 [Desulfobacteraceae bacterium]|nr:MAG: hypothetical protein C4519_00840 [Desulfobacteraceae bacterium]